MLRPGGYYPRGGRLTEHQNRPLHGDTMLKTLVAKLRTAPPEPIVWWGRHSDIWLDPNATDHGWYCGRCGRNQSQYRTGTDARRAAQEHAETHDSVIVALWT